MWSKYEKLKIPRVRQIEASANACHARFKGLRPSQALGSMALKPPMAAPVKPPKAKPPPKPRKVVQGASAAASKASKRPKAKKPVSEKKKAVAEPSKVFLVLAGAPSLPKPKRKKPQLSLPLPLPPDLNQLLASPDASDDNEPGLPSSSDSGFRSDLPTGDFKGAARRPPTPPKRRSASANGVSEEKSNAVLSDAELVRQMLKEERQHQQRAIAAADLPSSPRKGVRFRGTAGGYPPQLTGAPPSSAVAAFARPRASVAV